MRHFKGKFLFTRCGKKKVCTVEKPHNFMLYFCTGAATKQIHQIDSSVGRREKYFHRVLRTLKFLGKPGLCKNVARDQIKTKSKCCSLLSLSIHEGDIKCGIREGVVCWVVDVNEKTPKQSQNGSLISRHLISFGSGLGYAPTHNSRCRRWADMRLACNAISAIFT